MGWQLSGRSVELCSCKMLCPCWLGPEGTPDQGWCGGALGFDVQRGNSDGIDLGGTKVAFTAEWPGNFLLLIYPPPKVSRERSVASPTTASPALTARSASSS